MNNEIVTLLKNSFSDIRCANFRLQVDGLIKRPKAVGAMSLYRLTNINTDSAIQSASDFKDAITDTTVIIEPFTGKNSYYSNTLNPIIVGLSNIKLTLSPHSEDDLGLLSYYGEANTISVVMAYCNDNDNILPLKPVSLLLRMKRD